MSRPGEVQLDVLDTLCSGTAFQSYLLLDVCEDTGRNPNAVYFALKRLSIKGLVSRRKSQATGNRKSYRWFATYSGRQLIARNRQLMVTSVAP